MEGKADLTVRGLWGEILAELHTRNSEDDRAKLWLGMIRVASEDAAEVTLAVPNNFVQTRVEGYVIEALTAILLEKYDLRRKLRLRVDETLFEPETPTQIPTSASSRVRAAVAPTRPPRATPSRASRPPKAPSDAESGRLPFGLESFVVGRRHRMAYSSLRRALEEPGALFNPLILYGDTGIGKTHLLQGAYRELRTLQPDFAVQCVDGERFLSHFVFSLKNDRMKRFRERYRELDVLILDDFHLLADKKRTQEEFLHTFDALVHSGAQILIACNRHPQRIHGLIEPLVNRLGAGLALPLPAPDYDARVEILRRHDRILGADLGDEALSCVADSVRGNVRDLLGAFKLLVAHAATDKAEQRNREWATAILGDLLDETFRRWNPDQILARVAQYYRLSVESLLSRRRDRVTSLARRMAVYLCREFTHRSLNELGHLFQRDASTLRTADKRMRTELKEGSPLAASVQEILEGLGAPNSRS